jgi:hypothetical protein
MVDTKSRCALRDIREIFADLTFQQQKLAGIDQTLDDATKAVRTFCHYRQADLTT